MSTITPAGVVLGTTGSGTNSATVTATGGLLLATGPGYVASAVVTTAGSANAVAVLYDGTNTSGRVLATIPLRAVAQAQIPNYSFANGLFVNVTGTSAGVLVVEYTGVAAV